MSFEQFCGLLKEAAERVKEKYPHYTDEQVSAYIRGGLDVLRMIKEEEE